MAGSGATPLRPPFPAAQLVEGLLDLDHLEESKVLSLRSEAAAADTDVKTRLHSVDIGRAGSTLNPHYARDAGSEIVEMAVPPGNHRARPERTCSVRRKVRDPKDARKDGRCAVRSRWLVHNAG